MASPSVLGLSAAPSPCPRHRLTLHLKQNYSEMKPGRTASGFTAVCQTRTERSDLLINGTASDEQRAKGMCDTF